MQHAMKRQRTTADPSLSVGQMQRALEDGLNNIGSHDLSTLLSFFKGCTWKTAASHSLAGLEKTEALFAALLEVAPTAVVAPTKLRGALEAIAQRWKLFTEKMSLRDNLDHADQVLRAQLSKLREMKGRHGRSSRKSADTACWEI